jgi:hypothetical protein
LEVVGQIRLILQRSVIERREQIFVLLGFSFVVDLVLRKIIYVVYRVKLIKNGLNIFIYLYIIKCNINVKYLNIG